MRLFRLCIALVAVVCLAADSQAAGVFRHRSRTVERTAGVATAGPACSSCPGCNASPAPAAPKAGPPAPAPVPVKPVAAPAVVTLGSSCADGRCPAPSAGVSRGRLIFRR